MDLAKELIYREIGELAVQLLNKREIDYSEIASRKAYKILFELKEIIIAGSISDCDAIEAIKHLLTDSGIDVNGRPDNI